MKPRPPRSSLFPYTTLFRSNSSSGKSPASIDSVFRNLRQLLEFQFGRHLDGCAQGPIQRTAIGKYPMHALGRFLLIQGRFQMEAHVNPPDHEDAFFLLDFAGCFGHQPVPGRTNFTRLQRAPEGSGQSTGRAGDNVIDGGRVRLEGVGRNFVVFRDGSVDSENHRVAFSGQIGAADRALHALDPNSGTINDIRHCPIIIGMAICTERDFRRVAGRGAIILPHNTREQHMSPDGTLLLNRSEIRELLTLEESISAVERAYRAHAEGNTLAAGLLHVDAHGGEFHVKAGGLKGARTYFALKANGGFFENKRRYGLPNIQGVILLCDGENGYPLALMDSAEVTIQRTGAATAVAAKYLARPDSRVATICGCGTQGRIQLKALLHTLPIRKVWAFDQQPDATRSFSSDMTASLGIDVQPTADLSSAVQQSDVCIACTPSRKHFLMKAMVRPGTFISAIGADSPDKQE